MADADSISRVTPAQIDWVARVLGIRAPRPNAKRPPPPAAKGMALWKATRLQAVASLTTLESIIRATEDPEKDEAIILLRAVRANLTETPETIRQVEELQRYIDTDDVVEAAETPNDFGVTVELRAPLSKALASLRAELTAKGN